MAYTKTGITDQLKAKAAEIESRYLNAFPLLSDVVVQAVGMLVDIYAKTGIKPPTKAKAKGIVASLEKV